MWELGKIYRWFRGEGNMQISSCNGTVTINGVTYTGNNISIKNDKVIIDGVVQQTTLVGPIKVEVNGDVGELRTTSGDVVANNVGSIVTTSGDVECVTIKGNVNTTSGDVRCTGLIGGNVNTMSGDIIGGRKR